jgi:hypothetical protein
MKLTIELDWESYRVKAWWHRTLCRWFGHPEFKPRKRGPMLNFLVLDDDPRPRCVRCHAPDPTLPKPEAKSMTFTFVDD